MKRGVVGAMGRIFAEEIARLTRRLAGIDGAQSGSFGCPQIFGGSLNVHPHLHTIAADGVFEKTDHGVYFHEAPPRSKEDVAEVAKRVRDRALRWLRRRGYLDERAAEELRNEAARVGPASGKSSGQRREDVAKAEVCREDDVREVRGLVELTFPSPA